MDLLSILGLLLGFTAIIGGNFLEGGELSGLYNAPAALIVFGGTIGAVMLQSPMDTFKHSFKISIWIFFPPRIDLESGLDKVVLWSNIARKEGLLGLEAIADEESDPFARKGLQLLVDGAEPESIRSILEVDLMVREYKDIQGAKIFDGMGGYAPTVGIVGAVMGLIHVMGNLADPTKLGGGIATAFVATIYGVGLANMVFLPIANKLRSSAHRLSQQREMMIEGLIAIADGENPRTIELKLQGYLDEPLV